jgi:enterobacterial common antigen flippase
MTANAQSSSYRRILWATTVVGGATLGALIIGLARNKAIALLEGPEAIGLFGIFTTLVSMIASVAGLGLDTSAIRQLSQASEGSTERAAIQRAVWTMVLPLSLLGGIALWLFRYPLAEFAAGSLSYASEIGWLGIAVAATMIGACQQALIQSYGKVADLARVRLWGALFATAAAIAGVYKWGVDAIAPAVIALPLLSALLAFWFGRHLPASDWRRIGHEKLASRWRGLASVGLVVMASNSFINLNELLLRSIMTQELGLAAVGLYVASHAIVWVNLSLVLNAMAADYYPRLSKVAADREEVTSILNQQLHVGLLLAGPMLAVVSLGAPILLTLLYSSAFADSALLLRLMLAAGVLRLAIWALSFVLLARQASHYLFAELAAVCSLPLAWWLVANWGLPGAAAAVVVSTAMSGGVYFWQVSVKHGVKVDGHNLRLIALLFLFLLALAFAFEIRLEAGVALGLIGSLALAIHSFLSLRSAVAR